MSRQNNGLNSYDEESQDVSSHESSHSVNRRTFVKAAAAAVASASIASTVQALSLIHI